MRRHHFISLVVVAASVALVSVGASGASARTMAAGPKAPQGGAIPLSGPVVMPNTSGWHCNADSCIDVIGTGLHVTLLEAQGFTESNSGAAAPFWYDTDGHLAQFGVTVPWAVPSLLWGSYPENINLPNGDQVCLVWYTLSGAGPLGNPCINIHS